jgi:magnesium transporter
MPHQHHLRQPAGKRLKVGASGVVMRKLLKKRSGKSGLSPGSLVHIGEVRHAASRVEVTVYDRQHLETDLPFPENACITPAPPPSVTWINIEGISQLSLMQQIGDCFGIHPLVLEDIVNTEQRPKTEEYEKYLFVVLRGLTPTTEGIAGEQFSLLIGENWVVSFQEGLGDDQFKSVRERLKNEQGGLRSNGADYLGYTLLDLIIDNYFPVLENLADRIEDLEDRLMNSPTPETLADIYHLKRELLLFHKAIWPLREVINSLIRHESPLVQKSTFLYLRDLYDHTIQVIETVETLRDMLSGMLDIYLSSASNRMNAIMKVLTIIATIFMPLTFIAGLYGMNFKYMPELEWHLGYPVVLALMAGVTIGMLIFFRKKKWI